MNLTKISSMICDKLNCSGVTSTKEFKIWYKNLWVTVWKINGKDLFLYFHHKTREGYGIKIYGIEYYGDVKIDEEEVERVCCNIQEYRKKQHIEDKMEIMEKDFE